MFKKILIALLFISGIAAAVYWFMYTKQMKAPTSKAINAIPDNAAVIFECEKSIKTWKKLSQTNVIWEELLNTETFNRLNEQTSFIDSLITANPEIGELINNKPLLISAHLSGANTFDFLYACNLPSEASEKIVERFFESISSEKLTNREYDGENIYTVYPSTEKQLSYTIYEGILLMSTKQSLLELGIRHLKSGTSITQNANFKKTIKTAGENVDANIYINFNYLPNVLNTLMDKNKKSEIDGLAHFANFSAWDISLKPNAIMMSGFTQATDSANNFLNLFTNQEPQEIELTKIIPTKTALLLFYGVSNMKQYQSDYQKYLMKNKFSSRYATHIENVNKMYDVDIEDLMLSWAGNEMALVVSEPTETANYKNDSYAVIHARDIKEANKTLNSLVNTICKKNNVKVDSTNYLNHSITHLNLPSILPTLFGWQFDKIINTYYTSINNYIVFANTVEALQYFIFKYENEKTLEKDENYQTFSDNLETEANIYLYSSIARSPDIYSAYFNSELSEDIHKNLELLNKFEGVAIQFSKNNNLFYSNGYLKYNPVYKKESGTIWESRLDTTINSKPYLVKNHVTNAKEIFVQDVANNIYLISNTGKIVWKKQIPEKIISKVVQIDVYKNKKLQLLFNTQNAIYLIDRNGNNVEGFPVKLKSPATGPIAVFDYNQNRNYRIFVPDESRQILCYSGKGEIIEGFKAEKTKNIVNLPIQYFVVNNKDHLCAVDNQGEIYLFNRRGNTLEKVEERLAKGIRSFYVELGKDSKNTLLVAADTIGNISKVSLDNKRETFKIKDFESSPYFEYKNINHDKAKEYIFLTNKELSVYSSNKTLLFKHTFDEKVVIKPSIFLFSGGEGKIGVVSVENNKVYLFDNKGNILKGFPYTGKTPFSIGDLNNEGLYNLVTGSVDNSIYVYQID